MKAMKKCLSKQVQFTMVNLSTLFLTIVNEQLMNEAEYLMKNYGDRGGCYPSRRITPSKISKILHMI